MPIPPTRPRTDRPGWGPAPRALSALGGVGLLALAARGSGWRRLALGSAGVALIVRAASSAPTSRLVTSGGDPHAFEARRSIAIGRPVAEVFGLLSDYDNYPDFMPNVADMETLPGLRHRWNMLAPGGIPIPVRDVIIELVPDEFVAWVSEPGSTLPYAGAARFRAIEAGTLVEARMSYGPPLGAVGDGFARLLGQDPGRQLEAILGRAKAYLETGRMPSDSARAG